MASLGWKALKINGTCYSYSAGLHGCMADKQVEQSSSTFTTQGHKSDQHGKQTNFKMANIMYEILKRKHNSRCHTYAQRI
jgi:hypothetical protein